MFLPVQINFSILIRRFKILAEAATIQTRPFLFHFFFLRAVKNSFRICLQISSFLQNLLPWCLVNAALDLVSFKVSSALKPLKMQILLYWKIIKRCFYWLFTYLGTIRTVNCIFPSFLWLVVRNKNSLFFNLLNKIRNKVNIKFTNDLPVFSPCTNNYRHLIWKKVSNPHFYSRMLKSNKSIKETQFNAKI